MGICDSKENITKEPSNIIQNVNNIEEYHSKVS